MSEISYWGGSSVRDGKTRRLSAGTFAELVARYINVAVSFPLTRKEFWALTTKERDTKKDGAFLTSCSFSYESEGRRCDEAATAINACIIDLDEGEFIKELVKHPDTISEALYPHNFVAWHTAKSVPSAPRIKIMLEVAPCATVNLKRFLNHAVFLLGVPSDFKGHKESSVVSQAQYRPILFSGDTLSPVISSRVNGIPMHLSDLPEVEPEEAELINGRTYAADIESDDFYGLAYLPVSGLKIEDIVEALNAINPDEERPVWVGIAAALRHQFTDEAEAQEAYEAFVDWSSRGSKYAGRKDCWVVWRSLRPYAKGRIPKTIRTVYKLAMDAGWDNTKVAKKLSKTIEEWFAECGDADEIMSEGAKRIAATPFKNEIVEEVLINKWRARLIALGGDAITKVTLKKELARVRNDDRKAKQESKKDETPAWLAPFVYVSVLDAFINLGTGVALKPAAFDRTYSQEMMVGEETPANGVPVMLPGNFALNVLKILRVDDCAYDPTVPEDEKVFLDKESGKLLLNSYLHSSVPVADPEFADRAEALIRELVSYLVEEEHLRELLLDYLALQHQCPGVKIPWSFMIQSAPGAGKGTLSEILQGTLGHSNVKLIAPNQMNSAFNEWAVRLVFGVFNEVLIPGERRDAVLNSIKPLISDPTISMNLKHRDGDCQTKNTANYIAFTNFKDAAHFTADDRRWCLCFSRFQTKAQTEALQKSNRFDEIRWLKTPEGASALRYFFLKRVISPDFPLKGHAPATRYKSEAVEASKNAIQIAIEDMIEDQISPLIGPDAIHDGALKQEIRNPRDHAIVSRFLSLMGFERYSAKRYMVSNIRGHIWVRTEKWDKSVDPVAYLKKRVKDVPELDSEDDEIGFE